MSPADLLQAASQTSRHGSVGCQPPEEPRRQEWQNQAALGGHHARQCGVEGSAGKAMATPEQRRGAALKAMRDHKISQRRTCGLVGVDPETVRRKRLPDHAQIRRVMHEIAGNCVSSFISVGFSLDHDKSMI
jgi:putative transposase